MELHAPVGAFILQSWGFSQDMIDTAICHEQKQYLGPQGTGLVDLIIVADLLSSDCREKYTGDLRNIPAFSRLGIDLEKDIEQSESFQSTLAEVSAFFDI